MFISGMKSPEHSMSSKKYVAVTSSVWNPVVSYVCRLVVPIDFDEGKRLEISSAVSRKIFSGAKNRTSLGFSIPSEISWTASLESFCDDVLVTFFIFMLVL